MGALRRVRTGKSLRRLVDESLAINGIPAAVFLGWVQQLEFDLQESPKEQLKFIPDTTRKSRRTLSMESGSP